MIIGIDARFYGPSGKGLGRYTQRLIRNLEKIDQQNDYVIFLSRENWQEYEPANPRFKKVRANVRWYSLAEQIIMPYLIKKNGVNLMHFPHFNVAVFCPSQFVVTIHDLILLRFPTRRATTLDPVRYFLKQLGYKFVIRRALKKAARVITVSNYTKQDILKNFIWLEPRKIAVTYEACDSVETGQLHLPTTDLTKYGIRKPYLLYVGNAYPHKNLEKLLETFNLLERQRPDTYQLVLVGKEDYFYNRLKQYRQSLIRSKLREAQSGNVIFFGFAAQPLLADLYRGAALYVFPSLLEGFGLPALEAMRYDLPVAASDNSACPEILQDAALYFNPQDPQDILKSIVTALDDQNLRKTLIEKGRQQIKKYSWQTCAQQTLEIYKCI